VRIQLKSGLRHAWRGPSTLQVGFSRRRGTLITGLAPADTALLETLIEALRPGLDLSRPGALVRFGDPEHALALLRALDSCGALIRSPTAGTTQTDESPGSGGRSGPRPIAARHCPDAAVWAVVHPWSGDGQDLLRARAGRHVQVRGAGRLATTLVAALAAAGVGRISVHDQERVTPADLTPAGAGPADLGRSRQDVAHDAIRRAGGRPGNHSAGRPPLVPRRRAARPERSDGGRLTVMTARPRPDQPDLVVLVEHTLADATRTDPLISADIPHLVVIVGEDGVVVGPLVRPGRGPCLRCLDLHRSDRDPGWRMVLNQVHRGARTDLPQESVSAGLAAGLAGLQVLAQLDGVPDPAALGATLEVELPDGLVARRSWPVHPACGCAWSSEVERRVDGRTSAIAAGPSAIRASAGGDEKRE